MNNIIKWILRIFWIKYNKKCICSHNFILKNNYKKDNWIEVSKCEKCWITMYNNKLI